MMGVPCSWCGHDADYHWFGYPPRCRACPGGVCQPQKRPAPVPELAEWVRGEAAKRGVPYATILNEIIQAAKDRREGGQS